MKRNHGMIVAAGLVFLCSLLFPSGCVKKSVIGEKSIVTEDSISAQEKAEPSVLSKGGKSVTKEKGTAPERPLRTEALRDEAPGEGSLSRVPDRPVVEKDKATQLMLARESSAGDTSPKAGTGRGPEAAAALKDGTAAKTEADLKDVRFDFDKFSLNPEDREILKGHADWLSKHGDYTMTIEGHCDERGTTEYNLALGERRAEEAKRFLVDLGVEETRIKTISYGEELPLDTGHDEQAWAKNRRAHFTITLKK